jgi:hypothetical protein
MNHEQSKDNDNNSKANSLRGRDGHSSSRISASEEDVSTRPVKGSRAIISKTRAILSIVNASNDKGEQLEILALNF